MDFTDITSCKRWLKILPANITDDDILNALIPQVTGEFLAYLSRDIFSTAYTAEKRNGNGQPRLTLKQFPVTAVASLTVNTQAVTAAPDPVTPGFLFDEREIYLNLLNVVGAGSGYSGYGYAGNGFPRGFLNVVVSYTAGYLAGDPVLLELKNAATQQVAYEYMKRNRIGEKSKTLGPSQTVLYMTDQFDPIVLAILNRHKRRAPVIT